MSSNNLMFGDYLANTWRFWRLSGDCLKGLIKGSQTAQRNIIMNRERVKELIRCTFASPLNKEQFKALQETNSINPKNPTNTTNTMNSINSINFSRLSRLSRIFIPAKWGQRRHKGDTKGTK